MPVCSFLITDCNVCIVNVYCADTSHITNMLRCFGQRCRMLSFFAYILCASASLISRHFTNCCCHLSFTWMRTSSEFCRVISHSYSDWSLLRSCTCSPRRLEHVKWYFLVHRSNLAAFSLMSEILYKRVSGNRSSLVKVEHSTAAPYISTVCNVKAKAHTITHIAYVQLIPKCSVWALYMWPSTDA